MEDGSEKLNCRPRLICCPPDWYLAIAGYFNFLLLKATKDVFPAFVHGLTPG